MQSKQKPIIIGISGASGIIYGIELLHALRKARIETHLVMSKAAEQTRVYETDLSSGQLRALADVVYSSSDIGAAIASGSFVCAGMIVAPCSMRSLAEIATGMSTQLLTRAADVTLKERRRLVLMVRETPLTQVHLHNMLKVTDMGGIIAPPVPAFYAKPDSLQTMVRHCVGRVLDLFDIDVGWARRWQPEETAKKQALSRKTSS